MMYLVNGLVGNGKSFLITKLAMDFLRSGFFVASNIKFKELTPKQQRRFIYIDSNISPEDLPGGDLRNHGQNRKVMIIFDEALSWFGLVGDGKNDPRKEVWSDWLRHSDKHNQEIYLLVQDWMQTAKWFRVQAQRVIFCHNSKKERVLSLLPFGFIYALEKNRNEVENEVTGFPAKSVKRHFSLITKDVYRHYDTAETFQEEKFRCKNIYESILICPPSKLIQRSLPRCIICAFLCLLLLLLQARYLICPPPALAVKSPSFWVSIIPVLRH